MQTKATEHSLQNGGAEKRYKSKSLLKGGNKSQTMKTYRSR